MGVVGSHRLNLVLGIFGWVAMKDFYEFYCIGDVCGLEGTGGQFLILGYPGREFILLRTYC